MNFISLFDVLDKFIPSGLSKEKHEKLFGPGYNCHISLLDFILIKASVDKNFNLKEQLSLQDAYDFTIGYLSEQIKDGEELFEIPQMIKIFGMEYTDDIFDNELLGMSKAHFVEFPEEYKDLDHLQLILIPGELITNLYEDYWIAEETIRVFCDYLLAHERAHNKMLSTITKEAFLEMCGGNNYVEYSAAEHFAEEMGTTYAIQKYEERNGRTIWDY